MSSADLLKSARRQQKAEKRTMHFARIVIVLFSAIMRCLEIVGSPKRRQKTAVSFEKQFRG